MSWPEFKEMIELWSGLDRDSLHIYATVLTQLLVALLLRRPLASIWPWLAAWIVTIGNEYLDLSRFESYDAVPDLAWDAMRLDIWNSMLLPTVLFVICRWAPRWMVRMPRRDEPAQPSQMRVSPDPAE